jgi:hypothetical protein
VTSRSVASVFVAMALGGCVSQSVGGHGDWYAARGAPPPSGDRIYVCHGYGCRVVSRVTFSSEEIARIAGPLARGVEDAEAERAAISGAVQRYETIVGARIGTAGDRAKMDFGRGDASQMDCIDEATNTTSLLVLLEERGHLSHHRVGRPVARGILIDGRYPHATAVLVETGEGGAGGDSWAVDSWPEPNGGPPLIQPLQTWMRSSGR